MGAFGRPKRPTSSRPGTVPKYIVAMNPVGVGEQHDPVVGQITDHGGRMWTS